MDIYFFDSAFYIALLSARDAFHARAAELQVELASNRGARFVTTEAVLAEVLTRMSRYGPHARTVAADYVLRLADDARLTILPQSHELFMAGIALYQSRPDKQYSLPDCISMVVCRERGITQILTTDHDFEQEGFTILL